MKVYVSEIPPEGLELKLSREAEFSTVRAVSPCLLSIKIIKNRNEILINGQIKCRLELQCSRCLNVFEYEVDSPLDIVFLPAHELDKEGCYELQKGELDIAFYRDNILDIDEIMNEQLALNIPMKPLCIYECKGICAKCGADLNKMQCKCLDGDIDERFKVLERLMKKKE